MLIRGLCLPLPWTPRPRRRSPVGSRNQQHHALHRPV